MSELTEALQTLPFWEKLTAGERELMTANSYFEQYKKGDVILHTATGCKGAMVVRSGQIRTYILSEVGREVTLYRLYPGDICALSASCLLDSIAFEVTIEAMEPTRVLVIPTAVFHTLKSNPEVELFLLRTSNRRFSDVMWTMQQILFLGIDRRVAIFLVDEAEKSGRTSISLTHDEIARCIGSAREVVTRVLKYFSEEGVVALSRGKITILNLEKLKRYM